MATTSIAIPHEGQKEIAAHDWVILSGRVLFALIFTAPPQSLRQADYRKRSAAQACRWLRWRCCSQDSWRLPAV